MIMETVNHPDLESTVTLEKLPAKANPENLHSGVDTGMSVGDEDW